MAEVPHTIFHASEISKAEANRKPFSPDCGSVTSSDALEAEDADHA